MKNQFQPTATEVVEGKAEGITISKNVEVQTIVAKAIMVGRHSTKTSFPRVDNKYDMYLCEILGILQF